MNHRSQSVGRTLDVLELFAKEKRPLSLSEIARLLKIPLSSCHDLLRAMEKREYLYELAPRAGFFPTIRIQMLAKAIEDNDPHVQSKKFDPIPNQRVVARQGF